MVNVIIIGTMKNASKHIDYKCTIWVKLSFDDNTDLENIQKKLEEGYLPQELCDEDLGFIESEFLFDTEEFISFDENNKQSTIEIYEDRKIIWENKIWQ